MSLGVCCAVAIHGPMRVALSALAGVVVACCMDTVQAEPVNVATPAATSTSVDAVTEAIRAADRDHANQATLELDGPRAGASAQRAESDRRAAAQALGLTPQQGQRGNASVSVTGPLSRVEQERAHSDLGLSAAVKDAIRPVYDDISKSGIAEALRSIKATLSIELSSDKERTPDATAPGVDGPPKAQPETAAAWGGADQPGQPGPRAQRTPEQIRAARLQSEASFEQLMEDIKPWVMGAVAFLLLAGAWRVTMGFFRWSDRRRLRGMGAMGGTAGTGGTVRTNGIRPEGRTSRSHSRRARTGRTSTRNPR